MGTPGGIAATMLTVAIALSAHILSSIYRGGRTLQSVDRTPSSLRTQFQRPSYIPFPKHNPFSVEKSQLGKTLFFDPRLSGSQMISCASCHNPALGWSDGLAKGRGDQHLELDRRVPTLLNVAWGWSFFWDGRADSLETQALKPITSHREMNLPENELVLRVASIPGYQALFELAFPGEPVSAPLIAKAIATYERTIVSGVAPFDRWIAGDETAISASALRGFELFTGKANCIDCHSGWRFTNESFADLGLRTLDKGKGALLNDEDLNHVFKTPTLRNIAGRAPYMHDGQFSTLEEVLENYSIGGAIKRPTAVQFIKPLHLSDHEKDDLVAFLKTLTSEDEATKLPQLPR